MRDARKRGRKSRLFLASSPAFHYICKTNRFHVQNVRNFAYAEKLLLILPALLITASCSHKNLAAHLVGADRDEHGCRASAGYTYSYALHDCIRVWDVGTRLEHDGEYVFAVFATDSVYCEIFGLDGERPICRRKKGTNTWRCRRKADCVTVEGGRIRYVSDDGTVYVQIGR